MSEEVVDTAPVTETAPAEVAEAVETTDSAKSGDWYESFKSSLGEEERKSIEKYKDGDSFKKGTFSAFSMIGKKGDIPAEDAPDEVRSAFWNKLGADKVTAVEIPDFGEEYGDLGAELKEYYGGVSEKIAEIAKGVAGSAKSVPDLMNKVMQEFIKDDAEDARVARLEQTKQMKERFETVAKKAGLSVDQLNQEVAQVKAKYGWGNDTSIAELLLTLAKETSNTNTLKDAHLNNTSEGLDTQFEHENAVLIDMAKKNVIGVEYDTQLAKVQKLIGKISEMQKRS